MATDKDGGREAEGGRGAYTARASERRDKKGRAGDFAGIVQVRYPTTVGAVDVYGCWNRESFFFKRGMGA